MNRATTLLAYLIWSAACCQFVVVHASSYQQAKRLVK